MTLEEVLLNRVKIINDGEWTLLGTPDDVILELETLLQREVKKGRVEELKKLNENLIKSGVEEKAEERIMLVIDDRLEELEG